MDKLPSSSYIVDDSNPIRNSSAVSIITFSNFKVKESLKSFPELDTEIITGKELKLSGELFWNKEVYIDRFGIKLGKRKKRDGISYFGISDVLDSHHKTVNDLIINLNQNTKNIGDHSHFSIYYNKNEEEYFLKLLASSSVLLHQIDYPFILSTDKIQELLIGKITVFISFWINNNTIMNSSQNPKSTSITLVLKLTEDQNKTYTFEEKDFPITIGRTGSKINIKNNSISKSHAIIDYSEDNQKFSFRDLGSTNGSFYVLGEKDIRLKNEMKFKLFEAKFTITEIKE